MVRFAGALYIACLPTKKKDMNNGRIQPHESASGVCSKSETCMQLLHDLQAATEDVHARTDSNNPKRKRLETSTTRE